MLLVLCLIWQKSERKFMKYVEALLQNEKYLNAIKEIQRLEEKRVFCKHDFSHLLDVCRIAYIMNLEYNLGMDKETVYLCGLLHDIGRGMEYTTGIPHEEAGVVLAKDILKELECPAEMVEKILQEIGNHRSKPEEHSQITAENVFWYADKKARNCFLCATKDECNWPENKRTKSIIW